MINESSTEGPEQVALAIIEDRRKNQSQLGSKRLPNRCVRAGRHLHAAPRGCAGGC